MTKTGKRGFTLIELLVVIAIIAIIAAMLLPVLLQAKESARMRVCASGLKALGLAMQAYMDDHSGYGMPPAPTAFRSNPWVLYPGPLVPKYIASSIVPYKTGSGSSVYPYPDITPDQRPNWIWICPGDINRGGPDMLERPCWFNYGSSFRYPGPTGYMDGDEIMQTKDTHPRKPLMWKKPRRDVLLADQFDDFHNGCRADRKPGDRGILTSTWVPVKSVDVLFLDLHVKAVTPAERQDYQTITLWHDSPFPMPPGVNKPEWQTVHIRP